MICGETLFSRQKAEAEIAKHYQRGTPAFRKAFRETFMPAEGYPGEYVEI